MNDKTDCTPERIYRNHIDMAASMLADENAVLRAELDQKGAELDQKGADLDVYREIAQEAIQALAKVTRERDQARRQLCVMRGIRREQDSDTSQRRVMREIQRSQVATTSHLPESGASA